MEGHIVERAAVTAVSAVPSAAPLIVALDLLVEDILEVRNFMKEISFMVLDMVFTFIFHLLAVEAKLFVHFP